MPPPRRLPSRLFGCAALALFCAAAFVWLRSYFPENLAVRTTDARVVLIFSSGRMTYALNRLYLNAPHHGDSGSVRDLLTHANNGTFGARTARWAEGSRTTTVRLPP